MYNNEKGKSTSPRRDVKNVFGRKIPTDQTSCSGIQDSIKKDAWNDSTSSVEQQECSKSVNPSKMVSKKSKKDKEVYLKDELSSSSVSQGSTPHENTQTKEIAEGYKIDKVKGHTDLKMAPTSSSERLGFSEASSLSLLRDCTDKPSISCNCKMSRHMAPCLEKKSSVLNLHGYENGPNLNTKPGVKACDTNICKNLLHQREESTLHENVFLIDSDCDGCFGPTGYMNNNCALIECHCKYHEYGRNFKVQHRTTHLANANLRNEEPDVQTETPLKVMCKCHPNTSTVLDSSQNTIPELYAAKVKVGHEDIPKQFIFNAVNYSKDQVKHQNENGKISSGKEQPRFNILKSISKKNRKSRKLTITDENEFGESENLGQKKDQQVTTQDDEYTFKNSHQPERIEVYYFDHGCSGYFRTTDDPPPLYTEILVDKVDVTATRFWAEIFGVFHVATTFIIAFILQLLRFLFYSIIRPLLVGTIQITSDYFFKPVLAILFNAILQPILIFIYNITSSIKDIIELVAQSLGYFLREIANLCRAIRLIDVRNSTKNGPFSSAPNNKTEV